MGRNLLCCRPREMSRWVGGLGLTEGWISWDLGQEQEEASRGPAFGAHSLRKENVGLRSFRSPP